MISYPRFYGEGVVYKHIDSKTQILVPKLCVQHLDGQNLTGLYARILDSDVYQDVKETFVDHAVNYLEFRENRKFHESLSFLERHGFLSDEKHQKHIQRMGYKKFGAELLLRVGPDLALSLLDNLDAHVRRKDIIENFIAGCVFVQEDFEQITFARVKYLCQQLPLHLSAKELSQMINKYRGKTLLQLPYLRQSNLSLRYSLFCQIVSSVDLSNEDVVERLKILSQLYGVHPTELTYLLQLNYKNQGALSDNLAISSVSVFQVLNHIGKDVQIAYEGARYSLEHDPFAQMRMRRKENIMTYSTEAITALRTNLSLYATKAGEGMWYLSKRVTSQIANPKGDPEIAFVIDDTMEEMGRNGK